MPDDRRAARSIIERAVPLALLGLVLAGSLVFYLIALRADRFGAYHDDGIYVATAKSLADGQGYRIISLPNEPAQTKYPPFYSFLLSLVWRVNPQFPQNLTAMLLLSVIATMGFLLMTMKYLVKNEYATQWQALIVVAMTALNWRTMILATSVYSEMVYAALTVAALYLAEKHEKPTSEWIAGLILGVAIGLSFLTRSSGIALLIAVALCYALKKEWRKAVLPVAVGTVFVVGWVAWCYVNKTSAAGVNVAYYTSYLGHLNQVVGDLKAQSGSSTLSTLVQIAVQNLVGGIVISVPLVCSGFNYGSLAGFSGYLFGAALCVLLLIFILVGAGFIRTLSKRVRLLHVYLAACMGLYLFWLPGVSYDRFLMPLLPFLLVFPVSELGRLASMARRGWVSSATPQRLWGALMAVVLSVVAGATVFGYVSGAYLSLQSLPASAARASEDALAIDWIKEHTDTSETLVCYRDSKYFLYTGRKAVRSFPMTEGFSWEEDEASMARLSQAVLGIIDEVDARYLVVTSTDFQHEDSPERHRRTFGKLIEQHQSKLVLVFESSEGRTRIYRLEKRVN